ncbi:hypothetical protein NC653_011706 [Populus alba x Populus x berolinensis]|uniref:Uncharacterized protein n=1 Tax=Populus alba x Populus x berolinensis TaxID=444605 RepID=A0AAD6R332_9ROSI|nr:hypothetical protein NC653_011706 [Populus alba x Populus x berolinensis]
MLSIASTLSRSLVFYHSNTMAIRIILETLLVFFFFFPGSVVIKP